MKFDRITTIVLLVIVAGTAAALVLSLQPAMTASPDGLPAMMAPEGKTSTESAAVNVQVVTVEPSTFVKTTRVYGELSRAAESWTVYSDVTGTITEVLVDRGDRVSEGDVVAVVDPSTAGTQYKERSIPAKASGVVQSLSVQRGSHVVSQSTPIMVLIDPEDLVLAVRVPERYVSLLKEGLAATCSVVAWPGETFKAQISYIAPVLDPVARTVDIELAVDPDARLKSGMYVQVDMQTEVLDDVLVVPSEAVASYLGQPSVFVVRNGKAVRVPITVGSSTDSAVVVVSGLDSGDQVITAGSVGDGSAATIVEGGRT